MLPGAKQPRALWLNVYQHRCERGDSITVSTFRTIYEQLYNGGEYDRDEHRSIARRPEDTRFELTDQEGLPYGLFENL